MARRRGAVAMLGAIATVVSAGMVAATMGFAMGAGVATAAMPVAEEFDWNIPAPFPTPPVPANNPMSVAKVALGRRLFYDARLSINGKESCASCHIQKYAFTDAKARAEGTTGEVHPRSSMSLANVAYNTSLTWANPRLTRLEAQLLVPILGTDPIEMGFANRDAELVARLRTDTLYQRLFRQAFPEKDTPTMQGVTLAIAAFERTIISLRSPYDRYRYGGDTNAISPAAKRGERFFFSSEHGSCFQCHGGWNFDGGIRHAGDTTARGAFFNTGLYNIAGALSYPAPNTGVHHVTGKPEDMGKFRPPTLRNVAVTAPYMHDGSIATLGEVLDHYAAGGRTITGGPNAGVGRLNPNKAPTVHGFTMTPGEKADVIALLESLTDSTFLRDTTLSNPWRSVDTLRQDP